MKRLFICISIVIIAALTWSCSAIGGGSAKAAPDELYFVTSQMGGSSDKILQGYMDKTGKIVIGPWETLEYKGEKQTPVSSRPFFEGMAARCFSEKNPDTSKVYETTITVCGFIDKTGKMVVEPKYRKVSYFSEGLAAVSPDGEKWGYIDKTGNIVIEANYYSPSPFRDGLAANSPFKVDSKRMDGYLDKTGKFAIEPKFDSAGSFGDGYASVKTDSGAAVIDTTGNEIKTCASLLREYEMHPDVLKFLYGSYDVYEKDLPIFEGGYGATRNGYVDKQCKLLIDDVTKTEKVGDGKASGLQPMSEKLGLVKVFYSDVAELGRLTGIDLASDGWFFVDKDFKPTQKDSFADARPFAEGLAAVKGRDKSDEEPGAWGFIKPDMSVAIPFCFDKVGDFRGGVAEVSIASTQTGECAKFNSKYYQIFIDTTGKMIEPQWPKQEAK